jgi:predicted protein tyrosine phosphatase
MTTAIVSGKRLYRLPPAIERRVRNLVFGDKIIVDYSTYNLFHEAIVRNTLWIEENLDTFDRLVVLCYSGHTALIKAAEELGLDVILFEEC